MKNNLNLFMVIKMAEQEKKLVNNQDIHTRALESQHDVKTREIKAENNRRENARLAIEKTQTIAQQAKLQETAHTEPKQIQALQLQEDKIINDRDLQQKAEIDTQQIKQQSIQLQPKTPEPQPAVQQQKEVQERSQSEVADKNKHQQEQEQTRQLTLKHQESKKEEKTLEQLKPTQVAEKENAKKDETFDDKAKQNHKENVDVTKKNDPTKIHQTDGQEKDKKLEELNRIELARTLRRKGAFIGPGSCGCSNCNRLGKQNCDCGKSGGGGSNEEASQKSDTAVKKMQSQHKKPLVAEDSLASKWQTPQFHPTKTHTAEEQHQLLKDLLKALENTFMRFIHSLKSQGLLNHRDAFDLAQQFKFTVTLDKHGQLTIGLYTPPGLLSNNQLALLENCLRVAVHKDEKLDLIDADQMTFHRLPTPLSMECRYLQKLFNALMDEYTHNGGSDAHDFICSACDDSKNADQMNITLSLPAYFSPAYRETLVIYIQQEMQRELGAGIVNTLNFMAPQMPQIDKMQEQQSLPSFNPSPLSVTLTLTKD